MEKTQRNPVNQPSLDWSYLYYLARTKLGFTEEEFWESSIEKLNDLIDVHGAANDKKLSDKRKKELSKSKIQNKNKEAYQVYIDQISFL